MTTALQSEHKNALQRIRRHNLEHMNPNPLVEYLFANKALSPTQKDQIKAKTTKTEQNIELLNILEQLEDWVYHCLLDAFKQSGQDYMLELISGGRSVKVDLHTVFACIDACDVI